MFPQLIVLAFISLLSSCNCSTTSVRSTTTSPFTSCKLTYFDGKGAAEMCRIILKVGKVDFEDDRIALSAQMFTPAEDFIKRKAEREFASNMNRIPVLHVDGQTIGQSKSIERFLAKKLGLMGSTDIESAMIDNVQENVRDIVDKYRTIRMIGGFAANPEKDAALDKWFKEQYAEWLGRLETSLPNNHGSVFTVGNSISYADISIWHLLSESFAERTEDAKKVSSTFKRLTEVSDAVAMNPEVKKWIETRPVTKF